MDKKQDIWTLLLPRLREYLQMKGVKIGQDGFFSCIHPSHPDIHPSCHIIDEEPGKDKLFYCFSGMHCGNIFHAAHFLEGKPISGIGFFQDTLPYLAKLFDIPYEPVEISEDLKREFQKRRAYEDAVNYIHSGIFTKDQNKMLVLKKDHPAIKHLLDRGITQETIRKFKIGCIDDHDSYLKAMADMGWTDRSYLEGADLARDNLFSPTGIIIPIFDDKNRPVGFVTRRTDIAENDKGSEKYVNSLNSDIYHKSKILFNFNNFVKEDGPLYIVEGYLDAVYLTQVGIKNVAAIGATVLTEEHIEMLFNKKVKNIIIALDGDEGGNRGVKIAIDRLAAYKTFNVRIVELPPGKDPDNFIRENGVQAFLELCKPDVALSPFAWMIKNTTFEDDPMETAQKAIPTIAAEESNISRIKMIRELSRLTGISEHDIKKDVDALVNKESNRFLEELSEINNYVQVQLSKRKMRDTKSILEESLIKIKNLEKQYDNSIDNKTEFVNKIGTIKDKIESGQFTYGLKPRKFRLLYENFDGIPYNQACLTLVGGRPSAGKTALMTALAIDIIDCDEEACIFYMSIDDTTELMALKILAVKSGLSTSQIKNYYKLSSEDKKKVDAAWAWLDSNSDRFIIADATAGNTFDALEKHVEWFMKNTKTKKRLFLLDNFHKLRGSDFGRGKKTELVSDQSERIKEITQINDLHLMMTVELRKLEGTDSRPSISDLKDSVQLEYDADIVILVHNDKQVNENTIYFYYGMANGVQTAMPWLSARVWKNKITGKCESFYYKLNSWNLQVTEGTSSDIRVLEAKAREKSSGNSLRSGKPV